MTPADLHELGLKLFPINEYKRPAMKGWQAWAERATLEDLRSAWRTGYRAFGIYLRPSGLVVFDADNQEAVVWCEENLPRTPMRTLTKRGRHQYYRLLEDMEIPRDNKPFAALKIDRKAKGYVVAPGSKLGGFEYKEESWWDTPLDELPLYPVGMFKHESKKVLPAPATPPIPLSPVGEKLATWFIDNSEESVQGCNGSKLLKRAASFFVNDMALPMWQAAKMLEIWNEKKARPTWSAQELQHALETSASEGPLGGKMRGWAYSAWRNV